MKGFLATDKNGTTCLYESCPERKRATWQSDGRMLTITESMKKELAIKFPKWEDEPKKAELTIRYV